MSPDPTPAPTPAPAPATSDDPLLGGLTGPQREAVQHTDGPLLVLAGPGSGKTRVITRRLAHLVERVGIPPWQVLAITFTNKAAGEMNERVAELLSPAAAKAVTMATFHAFCARVLREHGERIGLARSFSIWDSSDQQRAIKQAMESIDVDPKRFAPRTVLGTISHAKNELLGPEAYEGQAGADFYRRTVAGVYGAYQKLLESSQAVDFDDLLRRTVNLLREHPEVRDRLRERYQYLLIDEYQDTNHAQFVIAHALAAGHQNICATGDPDQSIYGWRGAKISNILDFEARYPAAKVIRLEQNYRSTGHILAAADQLIRNNRDRRHKQLWTENGAGEAVRVLTLPDEHAEAAWLVERLRQARKELSIDWSGMALFYRVNALSRVLEEALRAAAIPYQIARGTAFFDRKEIKEAVSYLRLCANPEDAIHLGRIINTPPRGIGAKTWKTLEAEAVARGRPIHELVRAPGELNLAPRAAKAVGGFGARLSSWLQRLAAPATEASSLRAFLESHLKESGLEDHYRSDKSDPEQERLANLGELVSTVEQFESEEPVEAADGRPPLAQKLEAFLERVSLVADVDNLDTGEGAVTLMTLHAAKGLEFPLVAIVGMEDGLLPHSRAIDDEEQMEEERRLAFVGMTRAERCLLLTHTLTRTVFGQRQSAIPSRFLSEIGAEGIERETVEEAAGAPPPASAFGRATGRRAATAPPPVARGMTVGSLVRHAHFGLGRVRSISRSGAHTRLKVDFEKVGGKTLLLEYAHLEVVDSAVKPDPPRAN